MKQRRMTPGWGNLVLIFASVSLFLMAAEVGIRLVHPGVSLFRYPNFIAAATQPDPRGGSETLRYDPQLGYEPIPGSSGQLHDNKVVFSAQGFRVASENAPTASREPILAVGDSFTEGWGVNGDETWPAVVEKQTNRTVLNGGVRAYGLDQVVLRTERLLRTANPTLVVLAFVKADIERSALSVFSSTRKPYFVPAGDGLELRNVPVPRDRFDGPTRLFRRILGYSYLLDYTVRKVGLYNWWLGANESTGVEPDLVACRLMHRFADQVRSRGVSGVVVALPVYEDWKFPVTGAASHKRMVEVLQCARDAKLKTLDAYRGLEADGIGRDPDRYYSDTFHFNAAGQALVAKFIAAGL